MIKKSIIEIFYLLAAISFILGLRFMSKPNHARKGNWLVGIGMLLSISVTLWDERVKNLGWIFSSMIIGSVLGILSARKIKINSMPLLSCILNAVGGGSIVLIAIFEFTHHPALKYGSLFNTTSITILFAILFAAFTFSGSVISFGKLIHWVTENSISYPLQKTLNFSLFGIILSIGSFILWKEEPDLTLLLLMIVLCILNGFLFLLPVSGNNIPVANSLLGSLTGISTLLIGFLFGNQIMIIAGIIVASSGIVLARQMSRVLNRSLASIFFRISNIEKLEIKSKTGILAKEISHADLAIILSYAKKIIIVPGYGIGVSQAHFVCHELEVLLEEKGVEVLYAIHPIAGRMPGHMNVLLAEAEVSYEKCITLEEANKEFPKADFVLVIGANDIVNPAAIHDKKNPLYGMDVFDVLQAKNVIVLKKTSNTGYNGEENPLFFDEKTKIILGDAKQNLNKIVTHIIEN